MSIGRMKLVGLSMACMACIGLNAIGQKPTTPQPEPGQENKAAQPAGSAHAQQHETLMANCLVYDNQAEVDLGRMAQEKSQSGGVKKFAGMMVQDHQAFLQKLKKFAPNAGELSANQNSETSANPSIDGTRSKEPNSKERSATAQQPAAGQAHDQTNDIVQMQRELAQQCLTDTQAKLSKAEGNEFDKCYVGMQIVMHGGMKSKLTVFARHASGEFKQLLDQALQTTGKHLEHAESLMTELDDNADSPRTDRRTTERPKTTEKSENR